MKTVLLPVKDFRNAKQRLSPAFDAVRRAGLARAMLADVLSTISRARSPERVVVFTASPEVAAMAQEHRFDCLDEPSVEGHSAAVNRVVPELARSSSHILSIASDLPTLQPDEIDAVFARANTPVSLIASHDGTGTNGVLFISPARMKMEYGENSLRRHLANAAAQGLPARVIRVPGIEFDLDTPDDLRQYLERPNDGSHTARFLQFI
jgi:2-phospho-L-lactate guanylyltransferase